MDFKWLEQLWPQIIKSLKGHPEAVLAVAMLIAGSTLYFFDVNPYFAFGLPVTIYVLYLFRMRSAARHKERMAEINIERIEKTLGTSAKARSQRAIERRRKRDGDA